MKFGDLLTTVGNQPLFETGLLLSGKTNPSDVRRQLSRWVSMGRIRQLRRGLYTFVPPYQTIKPHPFIIANALVPGSYVSGQSALAYHGLIPEYTPRTISMTLPGHRIGTANSPIITLPGICFLAIDPWTSFQGKPPLWHFQKKPCSTWRTSPAIQTLPIIFRNFDCKIWKHWTWIDWQTLLNVQASPNGDGWQVKLQNWLFRKKGNTG